MNRHRNIVAAAVVVLVVSSLSGCALVGLPAPGLYDHVNSEAKKLHLKDMGDLECVGNYGLGLFEDHPTFKAVLLGNDARKVLETKLIEIGFDPPLGGGLEKSSVLQLVNKDSQMAEYTAEVIEVHAGDRITLQGQKDCVVNEAGAAIYIQ